MTNTTKNGGRQTALNLDGGAFDEAAYRAELIAAGLPAEDAPPWRPRRPTPAAMP